MTRLAPKGTSRAVYAIPVDQTLCDFARPFCGRASLRSRVFNPALCAKHERQKTARYAAGGQWALYECGHELVETSEPLTEE